MTGINLSQNYRILYIEDSNDYFNIMKNELKNLLHCELVHSETLEQASGLITDSLFDIIFMDYKLPDGNGYDFLLKLRRMHLDIPIIFMTDRQNEALGIKAVGNGAFDYLVKEQLSHTVILSMISNTLQKADIKREVENAQNRIAMISRKDDLTKLDNRKCFEDELSSEIAKSRRYQLPLSILIVDFDNFKQFNQEYGYDTGDDVLTKSAAIIQSMVRGTDTVCRYGGEEFGIVLPNTGLNGAKILAERIKDRISQNEFKTQTLSLNLTVSIGMASYLTKNGKINKNFINQALDALTEAGKEGGNRVKAIIQ